MKLPAPLIFKALFFLLFSNGALLSAPLERSLSTSRQFIVYGANRPWRGAVSDLAEQTKSNLLRVLQQRDEWKTPIVINLQFPQANLPEIPPTALHFSQTGFGLKLQLDLIVTGEADAAAMQREMLRAILLELIYRNRPDLAPGTVFVQPPDWLLDGLLATAPDQDKAPLVEAITPLVNSNKTLSLQEFLRQKPANLDSPARLLYRAYSLALLQLLLDQPSGRSRLATYIGKLARASNDPLADLKAQFPAMASDEGDTLWKQHVARFTSTNRFQLLTFVETDSKLEELLRIKFPGVSGSAKEMRLEDFLRTKVSPVQAAVLRGVSQNLMLLSASAHPVMRPLVAEYQEIARLASRNKRGGLAQRLSRLKTTRTKIVGRMSEIDDYMNWFEATQSNTKSGVFIDYLKAAGESAERRRHDPLSVYLDAMEEQFQN
jgi:hypothetical protein